MTCFKMTSVERIHEYGNLRKEEFSESLVQVPDEWPSMGEIRFDNVSFAYDENLRNILNNVSFSIKPNEKVGIIGRTGAGKSTILQSLFRMAEPSGHIWVDGVDIKQIGLHVLRSKIAIITVSAHGNPIEPVKP